MNTRSDSLSNQLLPSSYPSSHVARSIQFIITALSCLHVCMYTHDPGSSRRNPKKKKKKKGGGVDRALHRFDILTHLHTRFKITLDPSSYLLYLFFVSIGLKSFQLVIIDRPNPMAWRVGNLDSLGSESRLSFDSIQRRHFSSSQTRRNRSYLSSRHSPGLTPGDFLMGKKKGSTD